MTVFKKKIAMSLLSAICMAQFAVLAVSPGEKAPPLEVSKWIKGGPVELSAGKDKLLYVIEFWATWCPPCRQSIPHLSELAEKYKDKIVFCGISEEPAETVEKFVAGQKDMNYNVAVDDDGETTVAYTGNEGGIPVAFLIGKDGVVQWRGHPMELDAVLDKVLDNTFDLKRQCRIDKLRDEMQVAIRTGNEKEVVRSSEAILKEDPADMNALRVRMMVFEMNNDNPGALELIDESIAKNPDEPILYFLKLGLLPASGGGRKEIAGAARNIVDKFGAAPGPLNNLAWIILTELPFRLAPLDVALEAAERSVELTGGDGDDPAMLDTLARAYYAVGRLEDAVRVQERSLKKLGGDDNEAKVADVLARYRQALTMRKTPAAREPAVKAAK